MMKKSEVTTATICSLVKFSEGFCCMKFGTWDLFLNFSVKHYSLPSSKISSANLPVDTTLSYGLQDTSSFEEAKMTKQSVVFHVQ